MRQFLSVVAIFFVLGLVTLTHYGINWDSINHLPRGQAYLHYFLTGSTDYSSLSPFTKYWQHPDQLSISSDISLSPGPYRSFYQSDAANFEWFSKYDGAGHPPLSDIFASLFNRILFGHLHLINDIDSYRVYGLLLAALTVGLVYSWAKISYGSMAGFVAALSLGLYPLFWSESHFNTEKDIPLAAFWSFTIYFTYSAIKNRDWKRLVLAGLVAGFGLGTKFNILFLPLVLIPWVAWHVVTKYLNRYQLFKLFIGLVLGSTLCVTIFILSWPYLWPDPLTRIAQVTKFYQDVGTTSSLDARLRGPLGINLFPIQWIVYTTPPVILVLSTLGLFIALTKLKSESNKVSLIFILWLIVPIIRASWPGTFIYGGDRQLMEFIPGLAILAGIGAGFLYSRLKQYLQPRLCVVLLLAPFLVLTIQLITIHPNENVYFNFLIGGLRGAKSANFPYWGNSFGSAYRQAVVWLNSHAEPNSKVTYAYELLPNTPLLFFRPDLQVHNTYRSGYLMQGEYVITLTYQGTSSRSYFDKYLELFQKPVYESQVDGVSVVKIWKNDPDHLIGQLHPQLVDDFTYTQSSSGLHFEFIKPHQLWLLEADFPSSNCRPIVSAYVEVKDADESKLRLPDVLPDWSLTYQGQQYANHLLILPFSGEVTKSLDLQISPSGTCLNLLTHPKFTVLD